MLEDSKDICNSAIIGKYVDRPTTGKFSALRSLCLAQFAAMYHKNVFMIITIFNKKIYQIPEMRMIVS